MEFTVNVEDAFGSSFNKLFRGSEKDDWQGKTSVSTGNCFMVNLCNKKVGNNFQREDCVIKYLSKECN